jgi:hypothetical protein
MDGLTNNVRAHYTCPTAIDRRGPRAGSARNAAPGWVPLDARVNSNALFALPCTSPHCRSCRKIS